MSSHRKIGGVCALEDLVDKTGNGAKQRRPIGPVGHQKTALGEDVGGAHHRQFIRNREGCDPPALGEKHRSLRDNDSTKTALNDLCKDRLDTFPVTGFEGFKTHSERVHGEPGFLDFADDVVRHDRIEQHRDT